MRLKINELTDQIWLATMFWDAFKISLANIRNIIINFEIKNPNKLNVEDSKVLLTESKIIKIRTQISTEKKV